MIKLAVVISELIVTGDSRAQYYQVLRRASYENQNLPWINPSCAQYAAKLIRNQPDFVRDVIMLAKIWNRNVVKMGNVSGRSHVVELVAMRAAMDQMNHRRQPECLARAIIKFLEYMSCNVRDIGITFRNFVNEDRMPQEAYDQVSCRKQINYCIVFRICIKFLQICDHSLNIGTAAMEAI